jgi:hypothetical protein
VYVKLFLLVGLCFLVNKMICTSSYAARNTYTKEIAKEVAECEAKLRAVCDKGNLFVASIVDYRRKKEYYLKLLNNFKVWLEQSKIIMHTLQPDEVQQNVFDFTQTCQEYSKRISEFLYWVEGKTPPDGFSVAKPDTYFNVELQRD